MKEKAYQNEADRNQCLVIIIIIIGQEIFPYCDYLTINTLQVLK